MMDHNPLLNIDFLSILTALPLAGALFLAFFVKGDDEDATNRAFSTSVWISIATFVFSLLLVTGFIGEHATTEGYRFYHQYTLVKTLALNYEVGIDGVSMWLILLTTLLTPISIAAGRGGITSRAREYCAAFLVLEACVIAIFSALDVFTFYLFFEASLIPMFLIIGVWGGENRVYAAYKFFLYTLAGSLLFLIALLYLRVELGTSSIPELADKAASLPLDIQQWLFLAFLASFAVKVPMWPVHTWLPDAHVQAPTGGSVILAGVLLKLGGYGLFRLSLPFFPEASAFFAEPIMALSVIGIVYGSLVALAQTDMKKLIAYSSVAHMGFVTLGLFSFNPQGIDGAIVVMISHGIVSAALFLCVGVLYDRVHTKEINRYGGVVQVMPLFSAVFMFFVMASAGLPGTSAFVGEFLALQGAFAAHSLYAAIAVTGVLFGAAYMLYLYKRVVFGDIIHKEIHSLEDMNTRELWMLLPLGFLALLLGIYPALLTDIIAGPVAGLSALFK